MNRNLWLVLGVLLVGSGALLVDALQLSPRAAFYEGDARRIDALLGSRGALEVNVLEAYAGLQSNFDPINRALLGLRDASAAAQTLQTRGAVYAPAAAELGLAAQALETEEAAIEQFKTDLALRRLSSHYFPLAAEALTRRTEGDSMRARRRQMADPLATLATLRADVERYEELPARDGMQRLEDGLSRLQTLRASLDDGGREELDVLSGHTRAILGRRERVDSLARSLVRSPVRLHLEAARAAYARSARRHAQRVGALQLLSGLLALAGVGVLARLALRSTGGRTR